MTKTASEPPRYDILTLGEQEEILRYMDAYTHGQPIDFIDELPMWLADLIQARIFAEVRIGNLEWALAEIAEGDGPPSMDPLVHASNTIERMREIAKAALDKSKGRKKIWQEKPQPVK